VVPGGKVAIRGINLMKHENLLGGALAFTRVKLLVIDPEEMTATKKRITDILRGIKGFVSLAFYEDVDAPAHFCSFAHYETFDALKEAYNALDHAKLYDAVRNNFSDPPEMLWFNLVEGQGGGFEDIKLGEFCSISVRTAAPGFSGDLLEEMQDIFQNLEAIPGFRGSVIALNHEVAEQTMGICFWGDKDSFSSSMPKRPLYDVRLYQRML